MKKITLENFQKEVMLNNKPVLLEFYGNFCPGCVQMVPILEQSESEYGNKIDFGIVDADQEEMLNRLLHVYDLPALLLFDNGKIVMNYAGFMPKSELDKRLEKYRD